MRACTQHIHTAHFFNRDTTYSSGQKKVPVAFAFNAKRLHGKQFTKR